MFNKCIHIVNITLVPRRSPVNVCWLNELSQVSSWRCPQQACTVAIISNITDIHISRLSSNLQPQFNATISLSFLIQTSSESRGWPLGIAPLNYEIYIRKLFGHSLLPPPKWIFWIRHCRPLYDSKLCDRGVWWMMQ